MSLKIFIGKWFLMIKTIAMFYKALSVPIHQVIDPFLVRHIPYVFKCTLLYFPWVFYTTPSSTGISSWVWHKVIYPKYSKHWPYTVAHTIDCVCSKMLNYGLNHGLFLSFFKLIPCPRHCICVSLFKFHIWILKQF